MRFSIYLSPVLKPFLLIIGATGRNSFVEVEKSSLHVHYGFFRHTFPVADVKEAGPFKWPWYGSYGLRTNLRGAVALVGGRRGVVRLRFRTRHDVRIPFRVPCTDLYLSLEDPDRFLAALERARGDQKSTADR